MKFDQDIDYDERYETAGERAFITRKRWLKLFLRLFPHNHHVQVLHKNNIRMVEWVNSTADPIVIRACEWLEINMTGSCLVRAKEYSVYPDREYEIRLFFSFSSEPDAVKFKLSIL